MARGAADKRTTISSIGIGYSYDEDLLEAVSRGGGGNSHFAENGDEAGAHLAGEVDGLLEQVIQAASLIVRPTGDVSGVKLFNDLPVSEIEGGFMVELGELVSEEKRKLLFEIEVPDIATLGLAQVCELELHWVETETMEGKTVTLPVNVNVVPGDEAAGRIANPEVTTELTFQTAQRNKREASDALARGDRSEAQRLWQDSRHQLGSLDRHGMSGKQIREIDEELQMVDRIESSSEHDINMARKHSQADFHRKNRKRGRESRGDQ
ncbi:MAG: Ca-activated chloride channel [Actinomycetota bacterium]|nr:Ca-activated chloride channel [Actinomycetota bacterium]